MKRVLSLCMCIFILTISIITYLPIISYAADNDFTLSIPSTADYYNIPASEVSSAINNRGDIYGSDHVLMWRYTPTDSYNWTSADKALWSYTHFSDSQLSAVMQSNNSVSALCAFFSATSSNNNIFSSLLSGAGALVVGDSDLFNSLYNKFTGNKNYLDAIEYDSSTGELTLLADQVTALRKELTERYYESIGVYVYKPNDTVKNFVNSSLFREMYEYTEDYTSDYAKVVDCKYAFGAVNSHWSSRVYFTNELSDYLVIDSSDKVSFSEDNYIRSAYAICTCSNDVMSKMNFGSFIDCFAYGRSDVLNDKNNVGLYITGDSSYFHFVFSPSCFTDTGYYNVDESVRYYGYEPLHIFKSYEALYNYVHGSQTAYLSSKVEEAGEDIKLSINDMNDNIGSKIDDLIDSINNKKEGMSSDELQDAIDKALDSISGKIDEIGDNTQQTNNKLDALLESVSGTNQILMQILGVTTDIRDIVKTTDEDGNQYTMSDVSNCFNTMFNNLKYAVLYGKNNVNGTDDSGASDDNSNQSGNNAINTAYVMNSTGLLCTLSGRSFSKCNPGDAFVGIYCKSDGYCGPILVSEDSRAVSYKTEGRVFDYTSSIAYANKTWYVSAGDYFMPTSSSSEGYATVISTDRLTPSDAALLLLQKAGVTENTVSSYASNADNTTSDIGDKEIDYKDGLLGKFPFSVPYQLYEWLQILQADEKVPQFTYNYGFLINHKGDTQYDLTIDLSDYQPWADVLKSFLRLSFTLCMSVFIYNKFKGEM